VTWTGLWIYITRSLEWKVRPENKNEQQACCSFDLSAAFKIVQTSNLYCRFLFS
jgi:hypothetical protein